MKHRVALVAVLTGLILLGCELGLRLAGYPVAGVDGFDRDLTTLFAPASRDVGMRLQRRDDPSVSFLAQKPDNGLRVFVLGASSVHGFPYGARYAFPARLQHHLAAILPQRAVEVVNCGVEGTGSWHVHQVAEAIGDYEPDIVVIYTGHNDWLFPRIGRARWWLRFLVRTRLYSLAVRTASKLQGALPSSSAELRTAYYGAAHDRAAGRGFLSGGDRAWVEERFERNLRGIVETVRAAGAVPVLLGLAQDLRDWEPGASRFGRASDGRRRRQWRRLVRRGRAEAKAGRDRRALAAYRRALRLDPTPATLHFSLARSLEAVGDYEGARAAYVRASDADEVPCGAPSTWGQLIAGVAASMGVPFLDMAAVLRDGSEHGLTGRAFFVDYVHPSLEGHERFAVAIVEGLAAAGLISPEKSTMPSRHARLARPLAMPFLRRREVESRIFLHLVLGRPAAALREERAATAEFSDFRGKTAAVSTLLEQQAPWGRASGGSGSP